MTYLAKRALERAMPRFTGFCLKGSGAHGAVYEVFIVMRGESVAMKVLHPQLAPLSRERFEREFDLLRRYEGSVNIVRVFERDRGDTEVETDDGLKICWWYTMELCSSNLKRELHRLSLEDRWEMVFQFLEGLADLAGLGIAHRDLKLENLLISTDGRLKIGDFGLARSDVLFATQGSPNPYGTNVIGTPRYIAPEIWAGTIRPDEWLAADQYAAGMVIYLILSNGIYPLPFLDPMPQTSIAHVHLHALYCPLAIPELPNRRLSAVDRVLEKMIAKDPAARWPDIRESAAQPAVRGDRS